MAMRSLLPRNWTIRVRLTALYGGMFFLAGAVLLGVTYLLVKQSLENRGFGFGGDRGVNSALSRLPDFFTGQFDRQSLEQIQSELRRQQLQLRRDTLDSLLTQG